MKQFGPWEVDWFLEDGARLSHLRFERHDLLTTAPRAFRPPKTDYGRYETRPVYGYDDCLPSVDACPFPGSGWTIPDHGELCWLKWSLAEQENALRFSVRSQRLPLTFTREIQFTARELTWSFEVRNDGEQKLPVQHVMHPLMPLDQIAGFEMPTFSNAFDERAQRNLAETDIETYLLRQPPGTANMLLLRGVTEGRMTLKFRNDPSPDLSPKGRGTIDAVAAPLLNRHQASHAQSASRPTRKPGVSSPLGGEDQGEGCRSHGKTGSLRLTVTFPCDLFPTIGIWWNNAGYPDEDGRRRNECAFEPIPGPTSSLADGTRLEVPSRSSLSWQIRWEANR